MKIKSIYILSIVTLLLAAFASPVSAAPARVAGVSGLTTLTVSASSASTTTETSFSTSYAPQPGDYKLIRGSVFLDLAKSRLDVSATKPIQVKAILAGYLPSPCHLLRVVVGTADKFNVINISVYSLISPGTICIPSLQPFTVSVPVGSFTSGRYSVLVNGMKLGDFSADSITPTLSAR